MILYHAFFLKKILWKFVVFKQNLYFINVEMLTLKTVPLVLKIQEKGKKYIWMKFVDIFAI